MKIGRSSTGTWIVLLGGWAITLQPLAVECAATIDPWTECCGGTGLADFAAAPCPNPTCSAAG